MRACRALRAAPEDLQLAAIAHDSLPPLGPHHAWAPTLPGGVRSGQIAAVLEAPEAALSPARSRPLLRPGGGSQQLCDAHRPRAACRARDAAKVRSVAGGLRAGLPGSWRVAAPRGGRGPAHGQGACRAKLRGGHLGAGRDSCYAGLIMNARVKQLLDAAQELSVEERAEVAQGLLVSLDQDSEAPPAEDVERAWGAEIARRVTEFDEGRVKGIPAAEVLERAREALRRRR